MEHRVAQRTSSHLRQDRLHLGLDGSEETMPSVTEPVDISVKVNDDRRHFDAAKVEFTVIVDYILVQRRASLRPAVHRDECDVEIDHAAGRRTFCGCCASNF